MKYTFLLTLVFSMVATMFAQNRSNEMEKEIIKIEEEFGQAMINNDAEKIASFLADDWIIIDPDGGIIDKARFLSVIQSGALIHEAMDSQDVRVRVYGTTAIVTALTSSKAKYMDREFSTRERATDVFVKRDGRWRCVITHLTTFIKK
jgi:ketosteroid isomerase-like protein